MQRHQRQSWLSAVLLVIAVSRADAAGLTYHVDATNGSDSSDGVSRPWKTIQKAFNAATPGSTVHVKGGTYRERLVLNVSGSAAAGFITFRSFASDSVILDATGITLSPLIDIKNRRYVRIQGFDIRNYTTEQGFAVGISGGSDHVEIRSNKLSNIKISGGNTRDVIQSGTNQWVIPIRVTGDDPVRPNDRIVIDGNEISNCEEGWGETITIAGNSTNWEITNNRISNCRKFIDVQGHFGDSVDPATDQARKGVIRGNVVSNVGQDAVGIYVDGAKDVVIERNTLMKMPSAWGIVVSCEHVGKTSSGIVVRDNLVYDTYGGIAVGGWIATYGTVENSQVSSNTLAGVSQGIALNRASRIHFRSNIITNSEAGFSNTAVNDDSNSFDYNLYYSPRGFGVSWKGTWYGNIDSFRQATGQDVHSMVADPRFVSAAENNFRLMESSPAIDRGDPLFTPGPQELDAYGNGRVALGRVDVGAHEFQGSMAPPATPANLRIGR